MNSLADKLYYTIKYLELCCHNDPKQSRYFTISGSDCDTLKSQGFMGDRGFFQYKDSNICLNNSDVLSDFYNLKVKPGYIDYSCFYCKTNKYMEFLSEDEWTICSILR